MTCYLCYSRVSGSPKHAGHEYVPCQILRYSRAHFLQQRPRALEYDRNWARPRFPPHVGGSFSVIHLAKIITISPDDVLAAVIQPSQLLDSMVLPPCPDRSTTTAAYKYRCDGIYLGLCLNRFCPSCSTDQRRSPTLSFPSALPFPSSRSRAISNLDSSTSLSSRIRRGPRACRSLEISWIFLVTCIHGRDSNRWPTLTVRR